MRKIPFAWIELTSQRVRGLRGTSELPVRPAMYVCMYVCMYVSSRDQILRHARGQGNINFPCSADHEQDWQPYPVDPYSAICDGHTYVHMYVCMYACMYVLCMYICIFIKLHITAQSGPVIRVILCHSH